MVKWMVNDRAKVAQGMPLFDIANGDADFAFSAGKAALDLRGCVPRGKNRHKRIAGGNGRSGGGNIRNLWPEFGFILRHTEA